MTKLPSGWGAAVIGEIADYVSRGRSPQYITKSDLPVINQRCVRWHGVDEAYVKFVDPATWSQWTGERYAKFGDILWNSTGTGTIGRAALFKGLPSYKNAVVDSHITIVRSGVAINPTYLFHYIRSPAVQNSIEVMQSGSTGQVELNRGEILAIEVPIAPLAEQQRIAAKITGLVSRTDRAYKDLDRVPTLISRYKQRILVMAANGELTQTWRSENAGEEWKRVTIQDVSLKTFDGPFGSNLKSTDYVESGVRVVRLENIGSLNFIREKETYVSEEKYRGLMRHTLNAEDVLFSSFIAEEIRVCVFPSDLPTPAINKADCFCIRPDTRRCLPAFLAYRLASPTSYAELKDAVHGATRPRVSLTFLKGYAFDLPPLAEQAEIVRRINSAFGWLDRITADHAAADKLLPKLDAAILTKAFRGELVQQDPQDEPAGAMLQRLQTVDQQRQRGAKRRPTAPKRATVETNTASTNFEPIRPAPRAKGSTMTKTRKDDDVMGKPYLAGKLKKLDSRTVQDLFQAADLQVADFYKQLAWEISERHIIDDTNQLRAA